MSKVYLKDVVTRIKYKVDKDNTDLEYYIGGEHFDNGEIQITKKGVIAGSTIGPAFHMKFVPGDVLLMSRNPHLRKAGVVDFEGICSNVSYVCRTKDENILMQKFLPFIFQSDDFWKFAEKNKKGSTNFFLNWSDFENYEFILPDIETQRKLVEILWAFEDTKTAYKKLLEKTDELVKSQFIDMFGLENDNMKTIGDIANICRGASPRPISKYVTYSEDGVNWIKIGDVTEDDIYITHTAERITEEGAKKSRAVEPGDFILSNSMSFGRPYLVGINGCVHDGWLIISDYQHYLNPLFFYYELRSYVVQRQFDGSANGSCVKNLNSDLVRKVKIHIPSMEEQLEFVEFAQQSDKSKFELKRAIENINLLIKSMIQKELN